MTALREASRRLRRQLQRCTPLTWLVLGAFVVVALICRFRLWYPQGDLAVFQMRLDALVSHPPLVGAYSRFQWSHPGPIMYYAYWPLYRLLGGGAGAMMAATLIFHGVFAALAVELAHRRGGRSWALLAVLFVGAVAFGVRPALLLHPWNPYLEIFVTLAFLVAAAGVFEDKPSSVFALPILATAVAQIHVGLVPLALLATGAAAVVMAIRWRRNRSSHRASLLAFVTGAAVAGVLWLPPLVQQLFGTDGNVTLLVRFFRQGSVAGESRIGVGAGLRIAANQFSLRSPWLGGPWQIDQFGGGVLPPTAGGIWAKAPVIGLLVLAGLVVAWRTRHHRLANQLAVAVAASGVGAMSIIGVTGQLYPYLVVWIEVIAIVGAVTAVAAIAVAALERLGLRSPRRPLTHVAAGVTAIAVLGAVAGGVIAAPSPYADRFDVVSSLSAQLNRALPKDGSVWFAPSGNEEGRTFISALMLQLRQGGHPVAANLSERLSLGAAWTREPIPGDTKLVIAEGDSIEKVAARPNVRQIAAVDQFTPAERRRLEQLLAAVEKDRNNPDDSAFARGVKAANLHDLLALRGGRLRIAVFEVP